MKNEELIIYKRKWPLQKESKDRIEIIYLWIDKGEVICSYNISTDGKYQGFKTDDVLYSFYVNEKFRDKGYGNMMMQHFTSLDISECSLYVHKDNHIAKHLFEKYGFTYAYDSELYKEHLCYEREEK